MHDYMCNCCGQVFPATRTFRWRDLADKTLTLKVTEAEGILTVAGVDEEGIIFILHQQRK